MQYRRLACLVLVVGLLLSACAATAAEGGGAVSTGEGAVPAAKPDEEAEVRAVVESFGKRLQAVSLLSPDAAQQIREQYSPFVSADLLQAWMGDPAAAPGRLVSSPWPDRIEVSGLSMAPDGRYIVNGAVMEVTSVELVNGGVAARVPVRIVVERLDGRWVITQYDEQ